MVYPVGAPPRTRTVHPVSVYILKVYLSFFSFLFSSLLRKGDKLGPMTQHPSSFRQIGILPSVGKLWE
jgi:hypothetical protein